MKTRFIILLAIIGLLTSCYEVYTPDIDTSNKVLVVNGMVTNKREVYHIILSYANTFNSIAAAEPVNNANVFVTDDKENKFQFNENVAGNYVSNSILFVGIPGRSYKLHIVTSNGERFESDYQQLLPESHPDSVYAEFDTQEVLNRNTGLSVSTHGANILADIRSETDSIPHFRFSSNLVIQYYYTTVVALDWDHQFQIDFHCWQTVSANSNIDLTGSGYSSTFGSIRKHNTCFVDDYNSVWASNYGYTMNWFDTTFNAALSIDYRSYPIHNRILYLSQYTLNNETYLYYKSLDEQMRSEGKLFDPIASQLNGNIKCTSDPNKKAIGFFEASSVNYSAFIVDFRNLNNSQPSLVPTPYILPPSPNGCQINKPGSIHYNVPAFWIFN